MRQELEEIIEKITERYQNPVRVALNCESSTYYRVEDLNSEELEVCAEALAKRVKNVCLPSFPKVIVHLRAYSELATLLSKEIDPTEQIEVIALSKLTSGNEDVMRRIKNKKAIIVNEVITTGRSCLEAHSKITMLGASVLCWATLIDRTFGPGPVSVAATITGDSIALLE